MTSTGFTDFGPEVTVPQVPSWARGTDRQGDTGRTKRETPQIHVRGASRMNFSTVRLSLSRSLELEERARSEGVAVPRFAGRLRAPRTRTASPGPLRFPHLHPAGLPLPPPHSSKKAPDDFHRSRNDIVNSLGTASPGHFTGGTFFSVSVQQFLNGGGRARLRCRRECFAAVPMWKSDITES